MQHGPRPDARFGSASILTVPQCPDSSFDSRVARRRLAGGKQNCSLNFCFACVDQEHTLHTREY